MLPDLSSTSESVVASLENSAFYFSEDREETIFQSIGKNPVWMSHKNGFSFFFFLFFSQREPWVQKITFDCILLGHGSHLPC